MAHKTHRTLPVCPNCQHKLTPTDNFCPKCGQENHDLRLPFGHVVYEVVEGFTHFDGKLWVTLRDIFTRPGRVPLDFIEGRRMRHVPPIRLYIFVSFFLFLLIGIISNGALKRSTLRKYRLAATFGPDQRYRESSLKALFTMSDVPTPDTRAVSDIMLQFPIADSTGVGTLRRWRHFTNAQLDSVIRLNNPIAYAPLRNCLRIALAALPPQLPWLPLLEPANTKEFLIDKSTKKQAGIDTMLAISLRCAPDDTLGAALFSRLKALSPQQRTLYSRVNDAVKKVTDASVVSFHRVSEDSTTSSQFSRLIDSLTVRSASNPIKFSFAKGDGTITDLNYTTEAAARADVDQMREMTSDERMALLMTRVGATPQQKAKIGFVKALYVNKALNRYVQDFGKSEEEIEEAQSSKVIKYISYSFFLLMPLVALFLYLFYRRNKAYYYVDHLIFSVNLHTVFFLLTIILVLLLEYTPLFVYIPKGGVLLLLFAAGPALYFLLSLRTVYRQSWGLTIAKFVGLAVLYSLAFTLLLGSASVLGIL
ncbi:DUF3667 domain-containing protein [Fibrella aquatilis]|uniref:DUF3667 domain-containing protein n=1 Tax=Fibrella aquatilis TaxID=2817059 RepID=A0A939K1Z3_9BACT|nr:DUF3667 domain-containing protein [Fibrella aquatilis]MBO0934028.1 DUF3667 domain-containing protein [Fibrella aquatilis]